jgi:hypothetical protein
VAVFVSHILLRTANLLVLYQGFLLVLGQVGEAVVLSHHLGAVFEFRMESVITQPKQGVMVCIEVCHDVCLGLLPLGPLLAGLWIFRFELTVKVVDDFHLLGEGLALLAILEYFDLSLLSIVLEDDVFESFEGVAGNQAGDIVEPHADDSVRKQIEESILGVLLVMGDHHLAGTGL